MTHTQTGGNRFAPGTFARPSAPASPARMTAAQTRMELALFLRNGEQLLVALVIPVAILFGLTAIDFGAVPDPRVDHAITAVLTISVMGTAFTGQAIAVGFDRRYGALKRLGGTPLPPAVIILGKILATLVLVAGQAVVLGVIAALLGWRPELPGLALGALVIALGSVAFSAMGLLLGGTLRAEIVLALANLIWFVLIGGAGLAIGVVDLPSAVADLLVVVPSYALTSALGTALAGGVPALAALSLVLWTAVCGGLAVRHFSFT
ncbi:ABC-2 type transport system permease protein [Dietzia kunjamensis subsp. schimae]|uniref:ABC-2 type transport system permease protein n=1 Tax=Dietzia kunjamensis subsp. schimae TaxID=498198 RepID=A0ABY1MYC0_9ACTN|nr:ABC transporter permease [Dietzia kunjamensis]MBB1015602.1 ABC transporter permease [Dietzia kunjamensis subsp. schimae]SMO32793.1 ABC-2 type transport system permease protein [Dietzia kunjamensis subsp. schimae]